MEIKISPLRTSLYGPKKDYRFLHKAKKTVQTKNEAVKVHVIDMRLV